MLNFPLSISHQHSILNISIENFSWGRFWAGKTCIKTRNFEYKTSKLSKGYLKRNHQNSFSFFLWYWYVCVYIRRQREKHCLRESSRTRTLLAWDESEQPSTASMPHIVIWYHYDMWWYNMWTMVKKRKVAKLEKERKKLYWEKWEDKERKKERKEGRKLRRWRSERGNGEHEERFQVERVKWST